MKKKVAIIGSGIAGLTLARLFQNHSNFEFVVYEKGEILNLDEGFGIQLSTNSVSILNKIGFDQLNKNERYCPKKLDFYSINLKKICDIDLTIFNSDSGCPINLLSFSFSFFTASSDFFCTVSQLETKTRNKINVTKYKFFIFYIHFNI